MTYKKLDSNLLREHKGKSFVGVTTTALCHDGSGRFLMMKRGPKARDENGCWDIVGGGLKVSEIVEDNLKREIKEELCTDAIEITHLGFRDVHRLLEDGTKTHWIALDHIVLIDSTKVKIGEPGVIDEIGWFTLGDLPTPLHSQFHFLLEKYERVIKNALQQV